MNVLKGTIIQIENSGNISMIGCNIQDQLLKAVIINDTTSENPLNIQSEIELLINESEIAIAKNISGSHSITNQLHCTVKDITKGDVFSRICLDLDGQYLNSLITTESCEKMNLNQGNEVVALVKANEIFLKI